MRSLAVSLALLAAGSSAASPPTCAKGLYMIVARGSEEAPGLGVTGNLTSQIADKVPGSLVVAVDYPATIDNYESSEGKGVQNMQEQLDAYGRACPDSKIAILGYSQGAQVSTDSVCGSAGSPFIDDKALSKSIMDNVVAIAIFGDPTHVANLTYDRGTSVNNALFHRSAASVDVCKSYASRIISYCDTGDVYCDGGSNVTVHHLYIERYGSEIVDFVVSQYQKDAGSSNSSSTTAPPAASTTSTPTSSSRANSTGSSPTRSASASTSPNSATNALAPAAGSLVFGAGLLALLSQVL
ncbi:carbohydrate esterase family 5 protein [Trichoderma austrokoningii]